MKYVEPQMEVVNFKGKYIETIEVSSGHVPGGIPDIGYDEGEGE